MEGAHSWNSAIKHSISARRAVNSCSPCCAQQVVYIRRSTVAAFEAEVVDVRAECFGDPQSVHC
jgi:hypothetical protein